MFVRCDLKRRVLETVCRLGTATSNDVAAELGGVSGENVSMTLLKCRRQGLVDRDEYKRGRVRGYVYRVLDRGKRRLLYYQGGMKANPTTGAVDVKRVVKDARADADILYFVASCSVGTQDNVFEGREKLRGIFLWMNKERIVSAFASERLLREFAPEVSEVIREASGKVAPKDLIELYRIVNTNDAGSRGSVLPFNAWMSLLVIKKMRELRDGQALLYLGWEKARSESCRLERELEEERRLRKGVESRLDRVKHDLSLKQLECYALSLENDSLHSQSELCLACVKMLDKSDMQLARRYVGLEAGMGGPRSGIREVSSGREFSRAEVVKKECPVDVSSAEFALNSWWNNLPIVPLKLPMGLFPGNNPNILEAALDVGFPVRTSRQRPAEPNHWPHNIGLPPELSGLVRESHDMTSEQS